MCVQKNTADAYADDGLIEIVGIQEGSDTEICLAQVMIERLLMLPVFWTLPFCG